MQLSREHRELSRLDVRDLAPPANALPLGVGSPRQGSRLSIFSDEGCSSASCRFRVTFIQVSNAGETKMLLLPPAPEHRPARHDPGSPRLPSPTTVKLSTRSCIQRRPMPGPEIRQGLGVHADPAAQPLRSPRALSHSREICSCARYTLDRRYRATAPAGYGDIRLRMAGPAFHRLDPDKQRRQVEPFDKAPNHANTMIVRHELIETNRDATPPAVVPPCEAAPPPCSDAPVQIDTTNRRIVPRRCSRPSEKL